MEKTMNTRVIQKHDSSSSWNNKPDFIPMKGEVIIYDDLNKIKIGDGMTKIALLPFLSSNVIEENNNLPQMFWRGSQSEYNLLGEKPEDILYLINDGQRHMDQYTFVVSDTAPTTNDMSIITFVI